MIITMKELMYTVHQMTFAVKVSL